MEECIRSFLFCGYVGVENALVDIITQYTGEYEVLFNLKTYEAELNNIHDNGDVVRKLKRFKTEIGVPTISRTIQTMIDEFEININRAKHFEQSIIDGFKKTIKSGGRAGTFFEIDSPLPELKAMQVTVDANNYLQKLYGWIVVANTFGSRTQRCYLFKS